MGDASEVDCGSVLWGQGRIISQSGESTPLYQGRSSNVWKGDNLTSRMEHSVSNGEIQVVELFVFIDNLVFKSVFTRGRQKYLFCLN